MDRDDVVTHPRVASRHATVSARGLVTTLLLVVAASSARAGDESETYRPPDSTRNPVSVEGQLDEIYEPRRPHVPSRGLDRVLRRWYDFKSRSQDRFGLRFGIAYTGLYEVATATLTDVDQAAGGIFEILGTWEVVSRRGPHPGTLGFRVENRHRLGSDIPPQSLFAEVGAGVPTATGYGEFDVSLAELWWEQQIVRDRFSIRVGKMLPFGYYDYFRFKNPKTDFTNAAIMLNPTIAWPQFGLGILTEIRPRRDLYVLAGIHDANGTPTRDGFDTFFDDQEFFAIAELGWDPGFLSDGKQNPAAPDFHATVWHADARRKAGRPEGWGVSVTGQHSFGDVVPFARYGYSDGGAALLEHLVMGGVAWTNAFHYKQDTVGLTLAWGRPSNRLLDDQWTVEFYYRMQFTRRVAVTPDVQWIVNPSANPGTSSFAVFGLRARIDL